MPKYELVKADTFRDAIFKVGLIPPETIVQNKFVRFPARGKGPRNPSAWCRILSDRAVVFGDFTTSDRWLWSANPPTHGVSRREHEVFEREINAAFQRAEEEQQREQAEKQSRARFLWTEAHTADGSPVATYLAGRWITLPIPPSLRFHPSLKHSDSGRDFPAMVGRITRSTDGEPLGIHRTYLAQDGKGKAPVDPAKMMLGSSKGGVVCLGEPGDDGVLMVGEGIETCLSAMQATDHPAWAALSTSGFKNLELPSGLSKVIILADNDKSGAGEKAARELAERLLEEDDQSKLPSGKRQIVIAIPSVEGDFNDLLRSSPTNKEGEKRTRQVINEAEKVEDPLTNVLGKARKDPGYLGKAEVGERISKLDREHRLSLRAQIKDDKDINYPMKEFDASVREHRQETEEHPGQREILTKIVEKAKESGELEFFRATNDPDNAYINVKMVNPLEPEAVHQQMHRETWKPSCKGFKQWLTRQFFEETSEALNTDPLNAVVNWVTAEAQVAEPKYSVFIRIGSYEGRLYLDLCDKTWRAIEMDSEGWRVINEPPVCFIRRCGMEELPEPVHHKDEEERKACLKKLHSYLNVDGNDFVLTVSWLLAALRDHGPYPILVLSGEQGSAKSTFSKFMRKLIDPNAAPLRTLPRDDRDLFIAAKNSRMLAFDNLSRMPEWISDSLCRLATEGSHATRELYTNDEETLIRACRPIILNGINNIATRSDLADRAIVITLDPIKPQDRRDEKELLDEFEKDLPRIVGALFDGVVEGLKRQPETNLPELTRMADFIKWAIACETAFWQKGTVWQIYMRNRSDAAANVLESDPVASAVQECMMSEDKREWEGSAKELLDELSKHTDDRTLKSRLWPNASQLSKRLLKLSPSLREIGMIQVDRPKRTKTGRRIRLVRTSQPRADLSQIRYNPGEGKNATDDGVTGVTGKSLLSVYGDTEHTAKYYSSPQPSNKGNFPSPPSPAESSKHNSLNTDENIEDFRVTGGNGSPVTVTRPPVTPLTETGRDPINLTTSVVLSDKLGQTGGEGDRTASKGDTTENAPVTLNTHEEDEYPAPKCGKCANFAHNYTSLNGWCEKGEWGDIFQGMSQDAVHPTCIHFSWRECGKCAHYQSTQDGQEGYCRDGQKEPEGRRKADFRPVMCRRFSAGLSFMNHAASD